MSGEGLCNMGVELWITECPNLAQTYDGQKRLMGPVHQGFDTGDEAAGPRPSQMAAKTTNTRTALTPRSS